MIVVAGVLLAMITGLPPMCAIFRLDAFIILYRITGWAVAVVVIAAGAAVIVLNFELATVRPPILTISVFGVLEVAVDESTEMPLAVLTPLTVTN